MVTFVLLEFCLRVNFLTKVGISIEVLGRRFCDFKN